LEKIDGFIGNQRFDDKERPEWILSLSTLGNEKAAGSERRGVAAAANMDESQRTEMIRGMVGRLSDRLHAQDGDVEGWLRLVRAYAVLGNCDKAKDAAADARHALADHPSSASMTSSRVSDWKVSVMRRNRTS
jgi:hypothetical protein